MLPSADAAMESDGFDIPEGQTLMSRLQWEDSPDNSPTDSSSSKASKESSVLLRIIQIFGLMRFMSLPQAPTTQNLGGPRRRRSLLV